MTDPLQRRMFHGPSGPYQPMEPSRRPVDVSTPASSGGIIDQYRKDLGLIWDDTKEALQNTFWFDAKKTAPQDNKRPKPVTDSKPIASVPPPDFVKAERTPETKAIRNVFDELFEGHTVSPYNPSQSGIAGLQVPDASKYRTQNTTNLKQFAKDLGVDLSDPYDAWAYIRDMSAGLLASNKNTFLGALGDAALLSNKNRQTMEAAQRELKAKLAMAKWKNDQDWAINQYKTDASLAGKLAEKMGGTEVKFGTKNGLGKVTGEDGKEYGVTQITKGADWLAQQHGNKIFRFDGINAMLTKDVDQWKVENRVNERHQKVVNGIEDVINTPDNYDKMLKNELRKHMYKGNLVWGATKDDRYADALQQARDAGIEGIEQFEEAMSEGRGQDAFYFMQAASGAPAIMKSLKSAMEEGVYTSLTEGEQGKLNSMIYDRASDLALQAIEDNKTKAYSPTRFVQQAMEDIIPRINWDIQGEGKFNINITEPEYNRALERTGDIVGLDLIGAIFNTDLTDLAEFPPDDPRSGAVLQLKDEIAAFNKNQYSLLSPYEQGLLNSEVAEYSRKIAQATGTSEAEAHADLWSDMLTHDVVAGGEDVWGSINLPSKYRQLKTWKVEPIARRQQARDNGFLWDSQRGLWWKPGTSDIKRPETKPDEIKLSR